MSAGHIEEIRVVLLGKTGAGKSSLANTLLGREAFEISRGLSSGTEFCQNADTEKDGKILQVTDTPGLCDTHRPEEEVLREVAKSIAITGPGPHVVLMVLRCDRRFTEEEYEAFCTLKALFGQEVCKHSIVVFVGIDGVTSNPAERQTALKNLLKKAPENLQHILSDCSQRSFAVDNNALPEDRKSQALELWDIISSLVKSNDGTFFQHSLFEEVNKIFEDAVQKRMSEHSTTRLEAIRETRNLISQGEVDRSLIDSIISKVTSVFKYPGKKLKSCSLM